MENLGLDRRKAIKELIRGHKFASQLREAINQSSKESGVGDHSAVTIPFAEDLLGKVLRSFTNTLLILDNNNKNYESEVVSQLQIGDTSSWKPTQSEDSQESCKSSSIIKERRGCYKRRRTSQTWEKESEAPIEDGHQWRKYGQKVILHAKHPRNYYRCTHKPDQHCQATKQVQKIHDDPPLYRTTYYGTHTCRNLLNPEIILDYGCGSGRLISFDNKLPTKQDVPFFSSSNSVKKECKEEEIQDHHWSHHQYQSSLCHDDYLISDELAFDSCGHLSLSSPLESHYSDVISEVLCDSVELDSFEPFK
ncbi:hypothetical protein L6164_002499 [Bauhinia variegata]|uniref:Uncharacterized protein n=1 Tax=Bauhinia variegata TaxID=167791 RepID=A0ACB9PXV8_BAUVA|nr:hypothetical protein L6164_002499 [Bauhinia variegata]